MLRQPIVVVVGHVDHGKTSLLDSVRQTSVASREAGAITQAVGASEVPIGIIESICGAMKNKLKVKFSIPGLLFIDTPGHEVFANLRKRGGSIADIAILVIDVNQGIQPQTVESIQLLRQFKTPFIIAATKIDAASGWKKQLNACFSDSFAAQRPDVQARLDEKLYELVGQLSNFNFSSERFDRVEDMTKQIVIVPVSAHSREGLQELLLYVAGLAQRYLEKRLELHKSMPGKGSILEVKEERGLGKTIDVILYDGVIKEGDEIAFSTLEGKASTSKVKAILRPKPLDEMRDPKEKFTKVKLASAATGIKIACEGAEQALSGSSLFVISKGVDRAAVEAQLEKEYAEVIVETEKEGVIIRADALGSLEAIISIFSAAKVPVHSAKIGSVSKRDVSEAKAIAEKDKLKGVIFAFNVPTQPEVERECNDNNVKLFQENVIYNLLEGYERWVEEEKAAEKKKAFTELAYPAKIQLLPGHCFRVNSPMICGVEILEGKLKKGSQLINDKGEEIGELQVIQHERKEVDSATKGQQVAISVSGPTYGRQVKEKQILYVDLPKEDLIILTKKYASTLSEGEKALVKEVKKIKGILTF